jgi:hypothetical protein
MVDCVDALVVEDAAHVGLELGTLPGLLKDRRGRGLGAAAVDIHQRGNLHVGDRQDLADMRRFPASPPPTMATRMRSLAPAQDWAAADAATRK